MSYYNYHSNIKKKLRQAQNPQMTIVSNYKYISPCLIVQTDNQSYPIREYRWQEYFELASDLGIFVEDKRHYDE